MHSVLRETSLASPILLACCRSLRQFGLARHPSVMFLGFVCLANWAGLLRETVVIRISEASGSLHCPVKSIAEVAETGDDVFFVI